MNINILNGDFDQKDAIEIITKFIDVKIKFQENKMQNSSNEEDLKMRENRIIKLQKDLYEAREIILKKVGKISLQSVIELQ